MALLAHEMSDAQWHESMSRELATKKAEAADRERERRGYAHQTRPTGQWHDMTTIRDIAWVLRTHYDNGPYPLYFRNGRGRILVSNPIVTENLT